MTLSVGTKIKDNDPRMTNRVLVIVRIGTDKVCAECPRLKRCVMISKRRIFMDGKPRRYGFNTVEAA